jgi:predicted 3-demethylubiquinone-9 3-methyltransferase (glyoxalase superfamily)
MRQPSREGEASMHGWGKEVYGLWGQIIPNQLGELMGHPDSEPSQWYCQAMLTM